MSSEVQISTASPNLPYDLYRDIAENLRCQNELHSLTCLALASKAWCAESQRVLFRRVCDQPPGYQTPFERVLEIHRSFLLSIIHNPTGLGPLVHAYEQHGVKSTPVANSDFYRYFEIADVANLTVEALPALVNLKHLYIRSLPLSDFTEEPNAFHLIPCTFKLESLRWGFMYYPYASKTTPFVQFLRRQKHLTHLEIGGEYSDQMDLSWLPDDACRKLVSATCPLNTVERFTKRRSVVGLSIWHTTYRQPIPESVLPFFRRLKYLSVWAHSNFMPNWGTDIDADTIVLELTSWDSKSLSNFPSLPQLRVLALIQTQEPFHRLSWRDHAPSSLEAEDRLCVEVTIDAFKRYPNLEYVVVEDMIWEPEEVMNPRRFRKVTLMRFADQKGGNAKMSVQSERFVPQRELWEPWWTAYGVGRS